MWGMPWVHRLHRKADGRKGDEMGVNESRLVQCLEMSRRYVHRLGHFVVRWIPLRTGLEKMQFCGDTIVAEAAREVLSLPLRIEESGQLIVQVEESCLLHVGIEHHGYIAVRPDKIPGLLIRPFGLPVFVHQDMFCPFGDIHLGPHQFDLIEPEGFGGKMEPDGTFMAE